MRSEAASAPERQIERQIVEFVDAEPRGVATAAEELRQEDHRHAFEHRGAVLVCGGADRQHEPRDAARQVAGASLRGLAALVNRSLLTSHPDNGRYALHELLRQYAEEKLEADWAAKTAVQQAHATYYANLMQQSWADFSTVNHMTAKVAIEQDIENIRAAWHHHVAENNGRELLKFLDSFWLICEIRGWYQVAIPLFEEAMAAANSVADEDLALLIRGKALGFLGFFTTILGQPEQGLTLGEEGIALIRPLNQPEALMFAFYCMTLTYMYLGDYEQTLTVAQTVRQIGRTTDDQWIPGNSLTYTATALLYQGKLVEAQQVSDEIIQKHTQGFGNDVGFVWAALVRGQAALTQGHYAEAKPFFERGIEVAQRINYRRPLQQAYDNLGDAAFFLAEYAQAERCFRRSLEISEEIDQTREMLCAMCDLARVWAAQGRKAEAVELTAVILAHPLRHLVPLLRLERAAFGETAERLRANLEAELEPDVYQAAWQRAQLLTLETAVAQLLR